MFGFNMYLLPQKLLVIFQAPKYLFSYVKNTKQFVVNTLLWSGKAQQKICTQKKVKKY